MTLSLDIQLEFAAAHALIDLVSNVMGVSIDPRRGRELLDVDAEVRSMINHSEWQMTNRSRRAMQRLMVQEIHRQANIEAITIRAIEELSPDLDSQPGRDITVDWVQQFFVYAQDISDERMQAVWAQILAGEFADPGRFSLRTLAILAVLRPQDAELFDRFCTFCWQHDQHLVPILYRREAVEHTHGAPACRELLQLRSLGLIEKNSSGEFTINQRSFDLHYHGRRHAITLPGWMENFPAGMCLLTPPGQELAPLMLPDSHEDYRAATVADWRWRGIDVVEYAME